MVEREQTVCFEKKQQKPFDFGLRYKGQKFFGSFFQKRTLLPSPTGPYQRASTPKVPTRATFGRFAALRTVFSTQGRVMC